MGNGEIEHGSTLVLALPLWRSRLGPHKVGRDESYSTQLSDVDVFLSAQKANLICLGTYRQDTPHTFQEMSSKSANRRRMVEAGLRQEMCFLQEDFL